MPLRVAGTVATGLFRRFSTRQDPAAMRDSVGEIFRSGALRNLRHRSERRQFAGELKAMAVGAEPRAASGCQPRVQSLKEPRLVALDRPRAGHGVGIRKGWWIADDQIKPYIRLATEVLHAIAFEEFVAWIREIIQREIALGPG